MSNNTTKNASKNAPLGNTTKFASPYTGELPEELERTVLCLRYYLQSLGKELMPNERIRICLRSMKPHARTVDILKKPDSKRAFYSGLMVCGSIWNCAVCAARITEQRRQELTAALAAADYDKVLITYTLQHNHGDKLTDLLEAVTKAFRRMKSGKAWQAVMYEYGWVGSVRSLEVTYTDANGWHVHIHELVLLPRNLPKSAQNGLLNCLKGKWGNALRALGFNASWERGVDLRAADNDVQEYVAKFGHQPIVTAWSIEHELTKAPTKTAKRGGRTPMQLLYDYGQGDGRAGALWREYARAFKGRKQLVWSRGLRALLGLGVEQTDAELAENVPSDAVILSSLTPTEWRIILKLDLRAQVLQAAAHLTAHEFAAWLADVLAGEPISQP